MGKKFLPFREAVEKYPRESLAEFYDAADKLNVKPAG